MDLNQKIYRSENSGYTASIAAITANEQDSSTDPVTKPVSGHSGIRKYIRIKRSIYLPIAIILIVIAVINNYVFDKNASAQSSSLNENSQRMALDKPLKSQTLNKEFMFPLKGQDGQEVSKFKYAVQNAELRDMILIKGEKATAVAGRAFLILDLKITNDFDQAIQINAKDYVRLQVNNSPEKLAPDIHNDPVDVQAISTKYTRLAFPINENDKDLTLLIGEISGPKETIKLNLK